MANPGKIQIWNMALGFIGTRTVASESERCQEAIQCALYWDSARRQALRDFPYNFAQVRVLLAAKLVPEVWEQEWRYAYGMPDGCLKFHSVRAPGGRARPFRIVHDADGSSLITTDVEKAQGDYTMDVESPSLWDDLFVGMLSRKLAAIIAVPLLKNNPNKVSELEQLYRAALAGAYQAGASEQKDKPQPDSWLEAR